MSLSIPDEIEKLCEERRALWATGVSGDEAKSLTARIDALYEEKRAAAADHGSPAARAKAIKRAVAERELDRLMTS